MAAEFIYGFLSGLVIGLLGLAFYIIGIIKLKKEFIDREERIIERLATHLNTHIAEDHNEKRRIG
jgi:hypothetical protein